MGDNIRRLALIFALLLTLPTSLATLFSQPQVLPPPSRYSPPTRRYAEEGYDAVWLVRVKRFSFNGTHSIIRVYYKLKILTDAGADKFFERRIIYNRDWETLIVNSMRTILPNGTVLEPPPDAVQDLPLVKERMYSNARQRVYQMPGVKVGSIIEANYTLIERFPIKGEFQDSFLFQDGIPIRYEKYVVTLPPNYLPFRDWNILEDLGVEGIPIEFKSYANNTYVWEARNVPALLKEPGRPPLEEIVPGIAISSIKSWGEIAKWWWGLVKEVLKPSKEIYAKALEVIKGGRGSKAALLYHWVEKNIKYVALEFGLGGFKPYKPRTVLRNLYGDCKDGATLLASMLRSVNLSAYLTLICSRGDVNPEFPALAFDHAIVAIPLEKEVYGSKWLFLDTTTVTNPYGNIPVHDQGKWALIVGINDSDYLFTQTPEYPPEINELNVIKELILNETGDVYGKVVINATGSYDWALRYAFKMALTGELRERFLKRYVAAVAPGAELISYRISNLENYSEPFSLIMYFKAKSYATPYGANSMMFRLPLFPPSRLAKVKWRYYPYVLGFPSLVKEEGKVTLPKGWIISFLPRGVELKKYWGEFSVKYSSTNGKVIGDSITIIKYREIPRWMYNDYVEFLDEYAKGVELPVIITKG